MTAEFQIAAISACSAIAGSVVGGVTTYFTTRHLKQQEWKQDQLARDISNREQLYSDYVSNCGKLTITAIEKPDKIPFAEFVLHHSMLQRIRLFGSDRVVKSAEDLSISTREVLRDPKDIKDKPFGKRQTEFCDACKQELDELKHKTL